ncbi:MAG TPA: amino acid adenylation domain-containing protein, partial [Pyrinomonadaceae bacterium]
MSRKKVEDLYPLSPLQQGLLFHTLYAPESGVYVEQLNCTLGGELDLDAFGRAWRQTVERHPILRTAFVWEGLDEPVQVVRRSVRLPFVQEDWRASSAAEQGASLRAYLKDDLRRGFDLSKAPLMRIALLQLSEDTYQFIWSYHHLMLDGWCIPLVLREVFAFYEAFSRGESFAPERPRPYRDYIAWLRRQDLRKAEAFWRQTLKGFHAPTPLPGVKAFDGADGKVGQADEEYGEQEISLPAETTAALQSLARSQGLTLNTLVQGAWALLLGRYSGERDVVFGVTVAGRPAELAGVEAMVGLFINTLPLRVEVDGGQELLPWLKSLQAQQTELRQYEYSPLVQVQGWSDVPRGMPLFESLLVFENYPVDASFRQQLAQLSVSNIQKVERTNYALNLLAVPGTQLLLRFSYDRRRFNAQTIERMLGHLQTVLENFVTHPSRRIAAVPLLAPAEQRQLLVEWNSTGRDYPQHVCLHELFEAQVERTPDAVALVFEDESVNYSELNRRANALAERLRASGVEAETRVGVYAERSVEMVVGLLGVLKAGGAYVPLEPTYPAERLSFMLADAQVSVLLTQERFLAALPPTQHGAEIICLDRDWKEIDGLNAENRPGGASSAHNAAYIIYTSGSTGRPKGVVNTHRGICNRLLWMQDEYELTCDDRVLQKTPFSFDVSVWEFFWPLMTGARLVVARPGGHQDSAYLVRLIARERITTLHFVPSMLSVFLAEEQGLEACRSLRRVICSGEALAKELQERFFARLAAELRNLYGPTEAAVDVSYWACVRDDARLSVPIGRPIANTQLYVLDGELQPVPVGVAGELYIAGVGLARGYLNRPELTAEKFIANPFGREAGARLYRTGDAARFLEGGEIEFLGRLDGQVKLRGFRIELGEIESVLAEHHQVGECVVVAREDARGEGGDDRRIAAYFVPAGETLPTPDALRSFLREKLPEYMLPSAFVALPALPLTPNGKLDRRALPAPEPATATRDGHGEGVRCSPLEEVLAGIWAEVLGLERVGLHDNFFESGGHSLLALRVVSRLRSTLKIEVPVRELFDAPTVAGFAASISNLQRAELGLPSSPSLGAVSRDGDLPPSFAQQRLWFLDQLEPGSAAYNIPAAIRLRGKLDVRALEESFNEVLRRHEVLRTSFATVGGQPVQRIAHGLRLELPVEDVRGAVDTEREAFVESVAAEEAGRAFNLEDAPLLRFRLLRLDEDEHILLLVMHHIISDGWSIGILIREVGALYEAFLNGRPSPLAELPVQYADYAVWQREWLQGDVLADQLAYWKRQLDGSPPRLQLPVMREPFAGAPESCAFRGAKQHFVLPLELSESLTRLSRREGATLFMTLLAALQTLLQRYTGEEDITIGTPVANRHHEQIEGLVGFFVNTLVMRTDLTGNPTFAELLRRVREVALGAYAHQDVPFEKLVEELHPARDLSHAPLFQVMFVLQNAPMHALELAGLRLDPLPLAGEGAKFDLTLSMEETSDGLKGLLEYNRDIFDEAAIGRLISHFRNLLEAVASDPARRLSELQLLGEDERRQLLVEWNDTGVEYERDSCLHELFERQVERTPDALAVSFIGEDGRASVLTYSELNARANKLARHLTRRGVGAEDVVGIAAARELETLVGVLAVLKAGGAYLPLDPAYPSARLGYMLADARARVLLTRQQHAESLPAHTAEVVYLDAGAEERWARESAENLPRRAAPENLAYIIYTSGSTGQPKGVMVSHRGLSNLSLAEALAFELKAESRVLQFASWSFDASVFETVMTLMAGATICFAPSGAELPGDAFTRFLREQSVNTIALTPTTLAVVPHAELPDLQTVITGGEPCPPELVARWADEGRRFFNVYGPTETTTWATFARCVGDGRTPAIGRPVANTQIYILDERLQPVPIGVVGELHIGGVALARGYLNRPELTAEKFIPDPFGAEAGARLYRTGDTARYRAGGDIEFVGRIDRQVKLRGFRIELGEIEAALAAHASVRECAVVVREDTRGERRIVAFATLAEGASAPPVSEWRSFLKAKLPEYMIPSSFVVLDAWPLTPGGKLDRRALQPAPEQGIIDAGEGHLSPARTPTEEVLAGIWAEVLGLERVGLHDNFFESGGHSLLATQLVSRVREVFKVELPLRDFFNAPTVSEVAANVESLSRAERGLQLTPITHAPRDGKLPLSFAQQRLWFLDQFEPGNSFYNVPSALRISGALDVAALEHSLNEVVRRHEILRATFESAHGQPRQVIAPVLKLSLAQENLQQLNEVERRAEVQRLAVEEAQRSFDLASAPLIRARLLQVAERKHVLLFTMHHIISDGWSVNVLLGEVAALYEAYRRGERSPLAELPIQYADFAAWQREWLDGEQLDAQLRYWREQLRDAPALLELPTDRPRQPVQTYRGATARFTLAKSLSQALQRLSRREGATLFMTLLAAFQSLLQRYSGAVDVVVGTPIAGRNRAEIEELIGFFVNTLVLRTTFDGDPSFVELLARVREVCLGAYAHQDVPFEKLVEELHPEREMSHTPLFQVMFSLQNAAAGAQLPGLELSSLEVESGVAKFDLTLGMNETGEGRLAGLFEYNTDLFDAETIERMIGHLTTLLEGIVADPERLVSELPLMTEEERRQVVVEWNETGRERVRGECVHEMFERQAEARPEAVAIACEGKGWTFAEVNARANKLARYLRQRGVGAEVVVGVLMERSAEMLVALLGVLKAGGAYLPLDPAYPTERLAFILQDAQIPLLLTEDRLRQTMFEHTARVVCVDAEREALARESGENPACGASADNLVYVIYTSGSTGRPKGVCVPHGALANHARAVGERYGLQPADRVLQFASMSFDVAAEELFASWARGATVVLMPPDDYLLQTFLRIIEEQQISVVNLSASYWYEWVAALSRREAVLPQSLRLVVTGSE